MKRIMGLCLGILLCAPGAVAGVIISQCPDGMNLGMGAFIDINHQLTQVAKDSPAERAGLQDGDQIVAVNGIPAPSSIGQGSLSGLLRLIGVQAPRVDLTIVRPNRPGWRPFTVSVKRHPTREGCQQKNLLPNAIIIETPVARPIGADDPSGNPTLLLVP